MTDYNLKITEKQAHVLVKALDLFSRIKCGQIKEVGNVLRWAICSGEREAPEIKNMELADQLLDKVQLLYFPEFPLPGTSYGIRGACGEDEKIAYDIQQVVRHQLAKDDVKPGEKLSDKGVWAYEPSKTAKDEKLAKIEKI